MVKIFNYFLKTLMLFVYFFENEKYQKTEMNNTFISTHS